MIKRYFFVVSMLGAWCAVAISAAFCTASWALIVKLFRFIVFFTPFLTKCHINKRAKEQKLTICQFTTKKDKKNFIY